MRLMSWGQSESVLPVRVNTPKGIGSRTLTYWFVAEQGQNLSACSGVAYEFKKRLMIRTMRPS
jgi:hypothetical protein